MLEIHEVIIGFARLFAQTLGLAFVFILLGGYIERGIGFRVGPDPHQRVGAAYFIGLCAFLAVFVPLSRIATATAALWIILGGTAAITVAEWRASRFKLDMRPAFRVGIAVMCLTGAFAATNALLWTLNTDAPWYEPGIFSHLGSVHSGRYGNYAWFIAQFNRVPFLAQNGGQSILAALHLLLGIKSPLAALMVWIPVSLAFLALLFFGMMRSRGSGLSRSILAVFLAMFANVGLSLSHVLVFDNGSPIGFMGYTDLIVSVGTFVLFCESLVNAQDRTPLSIALVSGLFGIVWAWTAPQNILMGALVACGFLAQTISLRAPVASVRSIPAMACISMVVGALIGALQFGSMLPHGLQENTGLWTLAIEAKDWTLHPGLAFVRSHWSSPAFVVPEGAASVAWYAVALYGTPLLGIALLGVMVVRGHSAISRIDNNWLLASAIAFAAGYAIYFFFDLNANKWVLSRFMVPGASLGMLCLGFVVTAGPNKPWWPLPGVAWIVGGGFLLVGTVHELAHMVDIFVRVVREVDPLGRRLGTMLTTKGPFVFELAHTSDGQEMWSRHRALLGDRGNNRLQSGPLRLPPGRHRASFRIEVMKPATVEIAGLVAMRSDNRSEIARKTVTTQDLVHRRGYAWADIDFDVPTSEWVEVAISATPGTLITVSNLLIDPD